MERNNPSMLLVADLGPERRIFMTEGDMEDAVHGFMGRDIEVLVMGTTLLEKKKQKPALRLDDKERFELG